MFVHYCKYIPTLALFLFFLIAMIRNVHDTMEASNFKYLNLEVVLDDYTKKKKNLFGMIFLFVRQLFNLKIKK